MHGPALLQVSLDTSGVQSEANVTDIHEALHFDNVEGDSPANRYSSFGIWSLRWSADGREIVAGANDACIYVYDVERSKV